MFGKAGKRIQQAKKLYDLQRKTAPLRKEMGGVLARGEESGVQVVLSGEKFMRVEDVIIDGQPSKRVKKAFNKAIKELQKKLAKKMQGMEGLGV